ncbi:MAG: DNA-3-methyladenine glycosylase I, partial [Phycisphaerales bacterium]|nr:DNA-3-methyladenine glycosylase I [Phycisphaerales bacterium]
MSPQSELSGAQWNSPPQPTEFQARQRCAWCSTDPLYLAYHDHEWGVPLHDERRLFEMLI